MYRDIGRYKVFSRRVAMLGGGKLALLGLLAGRMYQLQVVESDKYTTLAEENRINLRLLPPLRGRILDRYGRPLAVNKENYRVSLVAEQVQDVDAILDSLSKIISLGDHERQRILRQVRRRRGIAHGALGDAAKQKELLERALAIEEKAYGPDHPEVAITLTNLGNAYGKLGDAGLRRRRRRVGDAVRFSTGPSRNGTLTRSAPYDGPRALIRILVG